jgi:Putative auto-transporter adhesin, head GIN domain
LAIVRVSLTINQKSTMKNKLSLFTIVLMMSTLSVAQTKETRPVETFTKISFRVPGKLYLKQGSPQKVEIEGDREALEKIETEVEGGRLIIGNEDKWFNWSWNEDDKVNVYITVKDIEGLNVSGSGDLIAQTKLIGNDFDLKVSGSGSLQAEIEAQGDIEGDVSGSGDMILKGKCRNYDSDVSGSGKIDLSLAIADKANFGLSGSGKIIASGSAQSVKTSISGSGKVLAANLEVDRCDVRISGSGDVEINVKSELDATISGSGSVSYKGNPAHVNSHASGSGHIRKM